MQDNRVFEKRLFRLILVALILFSIGIILLRVFVPISYDLVFYEQYYRLSIASLEPLFRLLFRGLYAIGLPFKLALHVLPFIWIVLLFKQKNNTITTTELWVFVFLIFGSQFFTLGILNALRQFYASLFILLPLMKDYIRTTKFRVFLYFCIASGLHWSSLLFFPLIILFYNISGVKSYRTLLFLIMTGLSVFLFLFKYLFIEDKYLTEFEVGRSSTIMKMIVIITYFSISSILVRKRDDMSHHIRFRFSLFVLLMILSPYGELFSRLLFFFSCYEVLFFFIFLKNDKKLYAVKLAYILLFIFYNFFSPNVINILWKQLLMS